MATQVNLNDLSNWLASQPDNTPQTPYEIEVTGFGSSSDKTKFRNSLLNNPSKYVDLSSMTLYKYLTTYNLFLDCTSLVRPPKFNPESNNDSCYKMFEGCTNLIEIPDFTDITSSFEASRCFYGCTSLTTVSLSLENLVGWADYIFGNCTSLTQVIINFPNSTNLESAFIGCTSLLSCTINAPKNTNLSYCFKGCTNLTTVDITSGDVIYSKQTFYYCSSLSSVILNVSSFNEMRETFEGCTSLTSTPTLPDNVSTMENTFLDCTSLQTITNIPAKVERLFYTFYGCRALTTIPSLKDLNVSTLAFTFAGCSSLIIAPELPKQVKNIDSCFSGCRSLEYVPNVPKSVESMGWCFFNCSNLVTIDNFSVSITVLQDSEKSESCFKNCSSLASVNVTYNESDDWHVYRLKFGSGNVSGKVYDKTKTVTTIASRQISGTDLKLPILSDELLFSNSISDSDLDALIEDVLTYKYTYTGDSTSVINPKHRSFVLWADDEDRVVTNLFFPADVSHASGVLPIANGGTGRTTTANGAWYTTAANQTSPTIGTLPVAQGGTGQATQANTNKAIIGAMDSGASDVTDGTEFVSSYASDNGFSDSNAPNVPYKRSFLKVWNYIKGKISSVLGLTSSQYGGNSATATSATRLAPINIDNIRVGSAQAKINLNQLMTWMITTKKYIPSNTQCFKVFNVPWSYAGNDILQVAISGINYEIQLAGAVIEFEGRATDYQTGEFRLRILTAPTLSFTSTSGYTKFPASSVATYTCNGSGYSPTWKGASFQFVQDSYPTILDFDGNNNWIKIGKSNTSYGLLPSTSGNAGSGHNYLGTSSWYWKYAYIDQIYGYLNGNISGSSTSCSGNAATASTASALSGFQNINTTGQNANSVSSNAITYYNSNGPTITSVTDGALFQQYYNANWIAQMAINYQTGRAYFRGKNSGTWQSWLTNIDSGNIGSQSVNNATKLSNISVTTTTPTSTDSGNCWAYITGAKITVSRGYRKYSNGILEQWGIYDGSASGGKATIGTAEGFLSYSDKTTYFILLQDIDDNNPRFNTTQKDTGGYDYVSGVDQQYKGSFIVSCSSGRKFYWYTIGY